MRNTTEGISHRKIIVRGAFAVASLFLKVATMTEATAQNGTDPTDMGIERGCIESRYF